MLTSFFSNPNGLQGGLIAAAIIVFFVVRQFTTRPVIGWTSIIPPLALAYFGVQGLAQLDSTGWFVLTASLTVAIALGTWRGTTFRIWSGKDGSAMMRGNGLTLAVWGVTLAVRIAIAFIENQV